MKIPRCARNDNCVVVAAPSAVVVAVDLPVTILAAPTPLRFSMASLSQLAAVSFAIALAGAAAPAQQPATVPTPESVLGFAVGADFKLASYDESIAYFQKLAAASNRIRLVDVGRTSTGHPWTL